MPNGSDSRSFLSGLFGRPIVAAMIGAIVGGLVVFVACFMIWYNVGGGAWRGKTHVERAQLITQDTILLSVVSPGCGFQPWFTEVRETEFEVQVALRAYNDPLAGGDDCLSDVELPLSEPLGTRTLIDLHTGQPVSVSTPN